MLHKKLFKWIFQHENDFLAEEKNFSIYIKANDVFSLVLLLRNSNTSLSTAIMKIDGVVNIRTMEGKFAMNRKHKIDF